MRAMRWVLRGLAGLVVVVLAVGLAGWMLLDRIDLGGFAGRRATAALGRTVTFGSLHITPGRWVRVQAQDARMANREGGTRPDMARLEAGTLEIEAWPLLHGTLVVRDASMQGLDLLLERIKDQGPNWHLQPKAPKPDAPPSRDGSFPDIARLTVTGKIVVRTSSGTELPVGLEGVTFTAPGLDQPTTLSGPGSYKGVPLQIEAALGSIAQYRDVAQAFPATIDLVADRRTHLRFEGTMVDPLGLDGAEGRLLLEAPTPEALFRIAGAEAAFDAAIKLSGPFEHAGQMWQLSRIEGALGASTIRGGTLRLEEGVRASEAAPTTTPDRLGVALQFERLDLDGLLGSQKKGGGGDDMSLAVERQPDMLVAAKLRAREVSYHGTRLADLALDAVQAPGEITVQDLSLAYLGGKVTAHGKVSAAEEGSQVSAELRVANLEVLALRTLLDMGQLPVTGRLNGEAVVSAAGATLNGALPGARASLVMTMAGGSVARQIVQLGSTDIRALFGKATGNVAVSCMLGVADMRGGVATITPVRLRTAEGTIAVHGTVDVLRRRVDVTVASEAGTTGALALDIPVRASGPFSDVSVAPAAFSGAGRAQAAAGDDIRRLPPSLQSAARASPCLGR